MVKSVVTVIGEVPEYNATKAVLEMEAVLRKWGGSKAVHVSMHRPVGLKEAEV